MAKTTAEQTESAAKPVETKERNHPKSIISLFILIVAVLALAVTFLTFQQLQNLKMKFASLTEVQDTNKQYLASLNQSQTALQDKLQNLDQRVQQTLPQRLYQQQDWLLFKARYYLELAQINAHWTADQATTLALLEQADGLLARLSEEELFAVRQAIAKEIAEQKALPKLDLPGLLSQLDAAEDALLHLPFKKPLEKETSKATKSTETKASAWQNNLKKSLSLLEKLVVIRHNETPIQPLLSPFYQSQVIENIRFNLQKAEWAALENNPEVYQLSLNRAVGLIKESFDNQAVATKVLIKDLQNLQQRQFQEPKIKLETSLNLLNQLIEKNNSATPKGEKIP